MQVSPHHHPRGFRFTFSLKSSLLFVSSQEMLRQEAAEAIAKLQIRKYRRTMRGSPCSTSKHAEQERRDSEVCAVCLDEFHNNQVRVMMNQQDLSQDRNIYSPY